MRNWFKPTIALAVVGALLAIAGLTAPASHADPVAHFVLRIASSATATMNAGDTVTLDITAVDSTGATDAAYNGPTQLTFSGAGSVGGNSPTVVDSQTTLAVSFGSSTFVSFTSGTASAQLTLYATGVSTIRAADATLLAADADPVDVTVSAGAASQLTIDGSTSQTAGTTQNLTVTARDASGNPDTTYTGTHSITFSRVGQTGGSPNPTVVDKDGTSVDFGTGTPLTFVAGEATVAAGKNGVLTLYKAGSIEIGVTDGTISTQPVARLQVTIAAAALNTFAFALASPQTSGTAFTGTNALTAQDAYGNTITGFDASSTNVTITPSGGLGGTVSGLHGSNVLNNAGDFSSGVANLTTLGFTYTGTPGTSGTFTASDGTHSGTSGTVSFGAGAATHYSVSLPANATAGSAVTATVTALDASNATATGYAGTVHLTSSDTAAVLGADATLTSGSGTFSVTLKTAGSKTVTANDTVTSSITGTSSGTTVAAAAAANLTVSLPGSATAGSGVSATVTAKDAFDNTATGYAGTVHLTSSDGAAVLGADATLTSGSGTFSVTLKTAGSKTVTATDTVTSSITGTSGSCTVAAATAASFTVTVPASTTAAIGGDLTVTAKDAFNNTATSYAGTVHFTSSDGSATLPVNSTLVSGTRTFTGGVAFKTAGSSTVTATDTVTSSITGTSNTSTVAIGATSTFAVSIPSTATAGGAISASVTAKDAGGNTTPSYGGTVHLTSSDTQAVLGADATLTGGSGTFSVTLKTAGSKTVTATDTVTNSITGTSNASTVSAAALNSFVLSLTSPQTTGTAFTGTNTVTARDVYGNTVTGFNAATDNVTITTNTPGATLVGNTLAGSQFASGVASLSGSLTYTGSAGTVTFSAASVSGKTGQAAITLNGAVTSCPDGTFLSGSGSCNSATVCRSFEFEASVPNATNDRVCRPLTTCSSTQFQAAAPTSTSDRDCQALTTCSSTQFQATAPTPTNDRICSAATAATTVDQCAKVNGFFWNSDHCQPLTSCGAGQYQSVAPTVTGDRVCSSASTLTCLGGQLLMPSTATADSVCVAACAAGYYVDTEAGACNQCLAIPGAVAVTCTGPAATDARASSCKQGFRLSGGLCAVRKPTLYAFKPPLVVRATGGQTLTLTGADLGDSASSLAGVTTVQGRGAPVPCAGFSWVSSQAVSCTLPAGLTVGEQLSFIVETVADGTSEAGAVVDVVGGPALSDVSFDGLSVTLTGTNLDVTASVLVTANPAGVACENAGVASTTSITCKLAKRLTAGTKVTFTARLGGSGASQSISATTTVPNTLFIDPVQSATRKQLSQSETTATFTGLYGYFGETAPRSISARIDASPSRRCDATWRTASWIDLSCDVGAPRIRPTSVTITIDGTPLTTVVALTWVCDAGYFGVTCELSSTLYTVLNTGSGNQVWKASVTLAFIGDQAEVINNLAAFKEEVAASLGIPASSITLVSASSGRSTQAVHAADRATAVVGTQIVGLRTIRPPKAVVRALPITLRSPQLEAGDIAFAYTPVGLTPLAVVITAGRVSLRVTGTTTVLILRLPTPSAGYRTVTDAGTGNRYGAGTIPNAGRLTGTIAAAASADGRSGAVVDGRGRVRTYGTLRNRGSLKAGSHATTLAVLPGGDGYLVAEADGRVRVFGAAKSYGDLSAEAGSGRVMAILPARDGRGYVLVTQSGIVRSYGTSAALPRLVRKGATWPIAAATLTAGGTGLLLVDTRGHVFAVGSARTHGDVAKVVTPGPVVGIVASPSGNGYTLVTSTGAAYRFGDAPAARARATVDQGRVVAVTA